MQFSLLLIVFSFAAAMAYASLLSDEGFSQEEWIAVNLCNPRTGKAVKKKNYRKLGLEPYGYVRINSILIMQPFSREKACSLLVLENGEEAYVDRDINALLCVLNSIHCKPLQPKKVE